MNIFSSVKVKPAILTSSALISMNLASLAVSQNQDLPNILWITSEDNSAFLGCYGDKFANTPVLDKFAEEGFLYTHAYANAPVCAPARNTIITGVYANSGGNQHMRSNYSRSDIIKYYPHYLKKKGYYTTNNSKEDYNIDPTQTKDIWDESSRNAHYRNRKPGQPFFAIFNTTITHESSIHRSKAPEDLRHDPHKVPLPPYYPDTPEIRHDWASYYDRIEEMDAWVGLILNELEESGEADNTVVFYYSDHGGAFARSKRYVYESGTHVPFIVRIPEKYKELWPNEQQPGAIIKRLISFVDLAPTLLSIIDSPIPDYMQGNAFLGKQKTPDPDFAFMFSDRMGYRYDMSRAVRNYKYRYIRNFMPYRIYGQHIGYIWQASSIRSWEEICKAGNCNKIQSKFWNTKPAEELYDTENDPWEVNNLALDPTYTDVIMRMREACQGWMLNIKDAGLIPEGEMVERRGDLSAYDYLRKHEIDLESIMMAAEKATMATPENIEEIKSFIRSEESVVRYWGVTGMLVLGEQSRESIPMLIQALEDASPNVTIIASETLYVLGEPEMGRKGLIRCLNSTNPLVRLHALNTIDFVHDNAEEIHEAILKMIRVNSERSQHEYDMQAAIALLQKRGLINGY